MERTYLGLLGARYRYVTGYPGNADARAALLRGEINFYEESLTGWVSAILPLVKDGTVFSMGQLGTIRGGEVVRDPRAADIPSYAEIVVGLRGEEVRKTPEFRALRSLAKMYSMLRAIVLPPGVEPGVAEALRKAIADTFADREFQAQVQQQLGFQFEFAPGAQAQRRAEEIIKEMTEDKEVLQYLRSLAQQKT